MSNQVSETLQDAFQLIEENELAQARTVLEPLLESDSSNPTVWWIYAHAVEDSEEGIQALNKVLELDPTYPGASELKAQISQTSDKIDDFDDLEFEEELPQSRADSTANKRSAFPRIAIIAVIIAIVLIGLFLLLSSGFGGSSVTPTEVADTIAPTVGSQIIDNATATEEEIEPTITIAVAEDTPTAVPESTDTDEPVPTDTQEVVPTETDEPLPTDTDVPAPTDTDEPLPTDTDVPENMELIEALSSFNITEDDITTRTTSIGETLIVTVCSPLGPQSSITLNSVMSTFIEQEASLPDNVEGVATALVDCESDSDAPRIIGVERTFVKSLADEEIELKDFQRAWKPLQ